MSYERLALWVLGPAGAGKTTLSARVVSMGFRAIEQDGMTESEMRACAIPLDARRQTPAQALACLALRAVVSDRVWAEARRLRERGCPLVYEATGNKPDQLSAEVAADRAAGYRVLALGLRTSLAECHSRNAARERVVSSAVVESTWRDFQRGLGDGAYRRIFGADAFMVVDAEFAVESWLRGWSAGP